MTTVEELQSMTHEDLVRRVQELEQDLKEVKEQSDMWFDSFTRLQARHESSINALDNIVKLAQLKKYGKSNRKLGGHIESDEGR